MIGQLCYDLHNQREGALMGEEGVLGGWRHVHSLGSHFVRSHSGGIIPRQHSSASAPAFRYKPVLAKHLGQRSPITSRPTAASASPLSYPNASKLFPNATPEAQSLIGKITPATGVMVKREWISKMSDILRDEKNKKISIEFGELKVDSTRLANAAKAFEDEKVLIIYDPNDVFIEKTRALATYYYKNRLLKIGSPYLEEKLEKSGLLHEAVHLTMHQTIKPARLTGTIHRGTFRLPDGLLPSLVVTGFSPSLHGRASALLRSTNVP